MKSKPFIAAFVIVTLAASFSAAFGFWPFGQSVTQEWLEKIGLPEGASYVGDPDIRYEDGNQPEMLLQEVAIEGDPESIRDAFGKQCIAAGFGLPAANETSSEPSMICMLRQSTSTVRVMIDTVCSLNKCRTFLELRRI